MGQVLPLNNTMEVHSMIIYYDNRFDTINFGIQHLKNALKQKGIYFSERPLSTFVPNVKEKCLVASFTPIGEQPEDLKPGGFRITIEGNIVYLTATDHKGIMYGLLDIAETVKYYGVDRIQNKLENPFLEIRGIKFNLPFGPFDWGDPYEKCIQACLDKNFWKEYIDFLALNRYNCLSLWSENPFHMMFRLEKYPETCPYSDSELEKYKDLFKFIFGYAQKRGIDVYLITWNIRIEKFVAKGLGLPEELGDMLEQQFSVAYDARNRIPNNSREFWAVRQAQPVIKDYFKECIKTLVMTYQDLKGIGTNCAEEMVGTPEERQNWVIEAYLEGIKESGRDIPFIMRTNMGNGKVAKKFMDIYPSERKYISWKYSNAHMYSSTHPQFEKLWEAWEGVNMDEVNVLYTVWNDDYNTFRCGDPDFLIEYIKGMKKPYVRGFYWGSDGYLWAEDFQHVDFKHKEWKYDFQKHWYQFELLGRLTYNPDLSQDIWINKFKERFAQWGEEMFYLMKAASRIIPAVNRLFWINYDFEWHPESLLAVEGFKTVIDFMNGKPMPDIGTVGIREFVEACIKGETVQGETPENILDILRESAEYLSEKIESLENSIPRDYLGGELLCTLLDLKAWKELGTYYYLKFKAAMNLVRYEYNGDENLKADAIDNLESAVRAWENLSYIWSTHYMPYKMARVKLLFGYPYYIDDVKRDIELAKLVKPRN